MKTPTLRHLSINRVRKFSWEILLASAITIIALGFMLMSQDHTDFAAIPSQPQTPAEITN